MYRLEPSDQRLLGHSHIGCGVPHYLVRGFSGVYHIYVATPILGRRRLCWGENMGSRCGERQRQQQKTMVTVTVTITEKATDTITVTATEIRRKIAVLPPA